MTIANELSADVATAMLVNRKGNPKELLKIVETVHLELRKLSLECYRPPRQQLVELVAQTSCQVTKTPGETSEFLHDSEPTMCKCSQV